MDKITLVFPGQGSQYVGMGQDFYDNYPIAREIFDQANDILKYDLEQIIFKPKKKILRDIDLNKNVYTQPAVLTCSYVCYKVTRQTLREKKISPRVSTMMGHSLGEYSALLASGAFDFETALTLVKKRAELFTDYTGDFTESCLMAVIDKEGELDEKSEKDILKNYRLKVAIHNSPSQFVLGGSRKQLGILSKKLIEEGKRATILKVEGPLHTYLMQGAAEHFNFTLEEAQIQIGSRPVIANVTANAIIDPHDIRQELYRQIYSKVNWLGSIEKAIANGTNCFIEIGPKKVMSRIIKEIDSSVKTMNVEDIKSLEKTIENLTPPHKKTAEEVEPSYQETDLKEPENGNQKSAD